jgi:hypothetical protein
MEEDKEPAHELEQSEEDAEWMKSNASRGKGLHQEEPSMGSMQQGLELEPDHEMEQEAILEGGVSYPQWKMKIREERSAQGIQHTHE